MVDGLLQVVVLCDKAREICSFIKCIAHGDVQIRVCAEVDDLIAHQIIVAGQVPKLLWSRIVVRCSSAETLCPDR